ncbi:rhodanese-like domain-containing protein [Pseudobdellovibrio exovorus]|uniref:Putative molybdopterin biosynthesis protein n=1 Tax=Pseudobdellovibrio exovorus JSS TaxID=1184267 RepID=M4V5P9_9BACT|nr:rhodanese-like domain-containing protein [Pseudobdellovibrio exovorus]AGH94488.1 putative molybdopterin biosynthesis protein [Pseudobdellovibrio exovorus JSS]
MEFKKTHLTCEQVYNIWTSEPELIQVLDLRPQGEYAKGHIPNATAITPEQLPLRLQQIGDRLAILVCAESAEDAIYNQIKNFENFVFLSRCHRWLELNYPVSKSLQPQIVNGIPEISVDDVQSYLFQPQFLEAKNVRLIDVRRPDEFNGELSHIAGATLVTLGPELTDFLEKGDRQQTIVFVCRSGARSGTATAESLKLGYTSTMNMVGGMLSWNDKKFPTERNS